MISTASSFTRPFLLPVILALLGIAEAQALQNYDVVPHDQDYYTRDIRNFELIYTEKNRDIAQQTADVQMLLQPAYEDSFGYRLDERLRIGLASDYNQIANGFTTPLPYARQVLYIGGALIPDYFSSTSWIDTLSYHETAHSYQMNPKDNPVSRTLHTVFKNGIFILPWFTSPNMIGSAFLYEGNAVLNESWHGNGGRLYSGRFRIATLMQARADLLTPERVYNDNLFFLYGSHYYTLGSYFQYFLAENYGLEKTNRFWLTRSRHWLWPFSTNAITLQNFGKDFETLLAEWSDEMKQEASLVKVADGQQLAESQFLTPLNDDEGEIYFLINKSGREYPDLVVLDKKQPRPKADIRVTTLSQGKVVKTPEGDYATQASAYVNPWRLYIGLFDQRRFLVDDTRSKLVEGRLADGRQVYFDVARSYDQPELYIGDQHYATVNSSVFIRGNDVYYFKQKGKQRTLYKNKEPLAGYRGYYGFVVGASDGAVYFIANTEHGSGLYRFKDGEFALMNPADTIIDARLISDNQAVAVSMGSDAYHYLLIDLEAQKQAPYEVTLFMEKQDYYEKASPDKHPPADVPETGLEEPYSSVLDMHYSGIDLAMGYDEDAGFVYYLGANFADPLTMNALTLFAQRNLDEYGMAGLFYANRQYFLNYALSAYGIYDRPELAPGVVEKDRRDYGLAVKGSIPFLRTGYYYGSVDASYFQDYQSNSRKPLELSATLGNSKYFGVSMDYNFKLEGTAYGMEDRGDNAYGGRGVYQQGLPHEFFISFNGQYSSSDAVNSADERGIKISRVSLASALANSDLTTVVMPGLKNDPIYVKDVSKLGGSVKKVFNFSKYYFTFPVSLRREALYLGYNRYEITGFGGYTTGVNEATAGVTLDTLWLNIAPIPINLEYVYTDDENIANKDTFRVQLGFVF
ncbi:MAG TPA: hypothetical protein ENJ11_07725 [Gammaproteobacteria bacterium]|nr:hypothetical protein [Gammaproteobacteria bacterium]